MAAVLAHVRREWEKRVVFPLLPEGIKRDC